MSLLQIKNLKTYFTQAGKTVKAVDGIDLSVEKSSITALVGESGSGKSVTALSATRLVYPPGRVVEGSVMFEGKDLLKISGRDLRDIRGSRISYIFQEPASSLNPVFTIGYQIAEAIMLHKKSTRKQALVEAEQLLAQVGIDQPGYRLSVYPHQLSGGMKQRVMIAMAISSSPSLLIADEPTTALDVTIQAQILNLLKRLKDELGLSVLLITHDLSIVESMADAVYIMQKGRVVETGRTKDIFTRPAHPYTKKLLDSVPKPAGAAQRRETQPILQARNLKKIFLIEKGLLKKKVAEVTAVSSASFSVAKGRTLGLVGESGSGKTTLARILAGILEADDGTIDYRDRRMQAVFQDPIGSLDPKWRIKDIVAEPITVQKQLNAEDTQAKVAALLKEAGLDPGVMTRRPHEFSGGERQRIAIARALAADPDFIICDEPVSSLDVSIQAQILKLLAELQKKRGLTYLFISHDLRVIGSICDRVMVMYKGKIVEQGETKKIFQDPQHPYTKELLKSALTL